MGLLRLADSRHALRAGLPDLALKIRNRPNSAEGRPVARPWKRTLNKVKLPFGESVQNPAIPSVGDALRMLMLMTPATAKAGPVRLCDS
jgi:hypothetical protein